MILLESNMTFFEIFDILRDVFTAVALSDYALKYV